MRRALALHGCLRIDVRFFSSKRTIEGVTLVRNKNEAQKVLAVLNLNKDKVHAWDTRLARPISEGQTPIVHGHLLCASCYIGENVDFGNGSRLLIDNDTDDNVMQEFKEYFQDSDSRKIFHNYALSHHALSTEDIKVGGFVADTWHLSRLLDSSLGSWECSALNDENADEEVQEERATATFTREGPGEILSKQQASRPFSTLATADSTGELSTQEAPSAPKKRTVNPGGYNLRNVVKQFKIPHVDTLLTVKELLKKTRATDVAELHQHRGNIFDEWAKTVTNEAMWTQLLYDHLILELTKQEWHTPVHQDSSAAGSNDKPLGTAEMYTGKNMLSFNDRYYRPFAKILCEIEAAGLPMDLDFLQKSEILAEEAYNGHMEKMFEWTRCVNPAIEKINIRSTRQVRQLLFGRHSDSWDPFAKDAPLMNRKTSEVIPAIGYFDDPSQPKNSKEPQFPITGMGLRPRSDDAFWGKAGWPSVSRYSLSKMMSTIMEDKTMSDEKRAETIAGVTHLRDAIQARFMISSYIRPLQRFTVPVNGGMRLYPTLMMDTSTGRLACRQPNLQSMPTSNDPFHLRKAVRAGPGNVILACDYAQLELRIMADHSNCKSMIATILKGGDIHSEVAADMVPEIRKWANETGGNIKEKFPRERRIAKALNFGIAYGISVQRVARDLEMPEDEASAMLERWYADKQEIKEWKEKIQQYVSSSRKVPSLLGRCRSLPLIGHMKYGSRSRRAAVNHCVQGSAADICMAAMIRIYENERLRKLGFRMILQVHDEIVLEGPREGSAEALAIVKECMESPFGANFSLSVPLKVDGAAAETWYDAKK